MSRQIKITKYEGNTHYNVVIVDSFGQEHHMGWYALPPVLDRECEQIWSNEVKNEPTPMEKAIKWCVDNDISKGREPSLD
jgi:hypothetical protein